jgi:hypothetical protein
MHGAERAKSMLVSVFSVELLLLLKIVFDILDFVTE